MISGFEWLNRVFDYVWQFVPQPILVDTRHGALKWTTIRLRDLARAKWDPSSKLRILEAGFHVYWPLVSTFEVHVVKRQTLPLPAQVITTTDDRRLSVTAVVTYDILDLGKAVGETWDTDDLIADLCAAALHDALSDKSYDELKKLRSDLLKNRAGRELKEYGVNVINFRLTTFGETEVYRMMQSTRQEGEIRG